MARKQFNKEEVEGEEVSLTNMIIRIRIMIIRIMIMIIRIVVSKMTTGSSGGFSSPMDIFNMMFGGGMGGMGGMGGGHNNNLKTYNGDPHFKTNGDISKRSDL